jgi:tetratricopeptide (TPR) repeat protein
LDLNDLGAAAAAFDSLAQSESPRWKARAAHGLAQLHWKAGRSAEAEKELWRSLGLDANSDESREALYLLAEISVARDQPGAASSTSVEDLLASLLKVRPSEDLAHYWLGRLALKGGQDGVALDHFRKATAMQPRRVEYAEALANAYFAVEECGSALKALKPVEENLTAKGMEVYGECLLLQGRISEAVRELERRYAEQPSPASLALWIKAMTASGKAAEAAQQAERQREFSHPLVRRALAEARIEANAPAVARRLLASLVAESPRDPELQYLLGRCAFLERKYAEAYKSYASALTYKADYPEALDAQGHALLKMGRPAEAHTFFRELADRDAPSWKAKGQLGEGLAFFAEEKNEAAEEYLQRSFRANPSAEAAVHLALIQIKRENLQEAGAWIQKARKLDPQNPPQALRPPFQENRGSCILR